MPKFYEFFKKFYLPFLTFILNVEVKVEIYLQPTWAKFLYYPQSDLPPFRPFCDEAPGPRFEPRIVAGTLTTRPPHLT